MQKPSSSKEEKDKKDELANNLAEGVFAGTIATGAASLGASGVALMIENAEKVGHKASAAFAATGAALMTVSAGIMYLGNKILPQRPSTRIKTHILDREYKLDLETFLGKRILIVDGKRERSLIDPSSEAERIFYGLKYAIDGTHLKLKEMLPGEKERSLYVAFARSFIEANYQMMIEFSEIIAQRKEYDESARDISDVQCHTVKPIRGIIEGSKAEFARY